jgi:hypothetical protein
MENPDDGLKRHHIKNPDDGTEALKDIKWKIQKMAH